MIHFKLKITWPLAILILIAVIAWLARDRSTAAAAPKRTARSKPPRRGTFVHTEMDGNPFVRVDRADPPFTGTVIFPGDAEGQSRPPADPDRATPDLTDDDSPDITYAEALRAPHGTYTEEQIQAIGDREAARAGRQAYRKAAHRPVNDSIERLRAWRPNREQQPQ